MIELLLTSFPLLFRLAYLRFRGKEVTLYNVHRAVFAWLLLFIALIFTIEYYHPDSETGVVPFRVVPVVSEQGGTVTSVHVTAAQQVKPGDLLFTVDDSSQTAAVATAQQQVGAAEQQVAVAKAQMGEAQSAVDAAQAVLDEANVLLGNQQKLRDENSPAYALDRFLRAQNSQREAAAALTSAEAELATAKLQAEHLAPAQLATVQAQLQQAQVELDKTKIRAEVAGRVEQLTLNVGDRASQIALSPAMVIVPDRGPDEPVEIVAGFSQVNRTVLRVGMPAEVACASNVNNMMHNSVLPARIIRIQESISAGQIVPSGRLIQPSDLPGRGDVVAYLKLEYPEQEPLLVNGSRCLVQAYTTKIHNGPLADTTMGEIIQAWAIEKAVVMRMKVWVMLGVGAGLIGGGEG